MRIVGTGEQVPEQLYLTDDQFAVAS